MTRLPDLPQRPEGAAGDALNDLPGEARAYVDDLARRADQFRRIGETLLQQDTMPDLLARVGSIASEEPEDWDREGRWTISAADQGGVIRKSVGGWVNVTPDTLDVSDTLSMREARDQRLPENSVLTRADMIDGAPVTAEIYSDDRVVDHLVDIRPWLAEATEEDIHAFEADGWAFGYGADQVALDMEKAGHPAAVDLFDYLSKGPTMMTGDAVGFAVNGDGNRIADWLAENRPDIAIGTGDNLEL